jgi:hypothetical protein
MSKSLLEQLPQIVANGKRQAERIMERAESAIRDHIRGQVQVGVTKPAITRKS